FCLYLVQLRIAKVNREQDGIRTALLQKAHRLPDWRAADAVTLGDISSVSRSRDFRAPKMISSSAPSREVLRNGD
ncbi:MAG: hypothetical protein QM765_53810, partial [Myxococcales bacterium]